jgi:hypothetical protein
VAFLDELHALRHHFAGEKAAWTEALLASADLRDAAQRDDAAAARTCMAGIARRTWPDSALIPSAVRTQLGAMGVNVRW